MLAIRDGEMICPKKKTGSVAAPRSRPPMMKGMAMSERLSDINSMFNVPRDTIGELIMQHARGRLESGPYSPASEFYQDVLEWIIGQAYQPDPLVDIFGNSRSSRARECVSGAIWKGNVGGRAEQIAAAMAKAQILMTWVGPGYKNGIGQPPLHMILEAISKNCACLTASAIIYFAEDFALCGDAMDDIMEGVI